MSIGIGTTPTHTISVEQDISKCTIYVDFAQNDELVLQLTNVNNERMVVDYVDGFTVMRIRMTQEETLKFSQYGKISIQVRWVDADNVAGKTKIAKVSPDSLLNEEVISYVG